MLIRAFNAMRRWEEARGIPHLRSPAHALFGIVLPLLITVPLSLYFAPYLLRLSPYAIVGVWAGSCVICWGFFQWVDIKRQR
ncbi:MAG: hypothetical protein AAGF56_01235 [Pseudomonadota bacterium]